MIVKHEIMLSMCKKTYPSLYLSRTHARTHTPTRTSTNTPQHILPNPSLQFVHRRHTHTYCTPKYSYVQNVISNNVCARACKFVYQVRTQLYCSFPDLFPSEYKDSQTPTPTTPCGRYCVYGRRINIQRQCYYCLPFINTMCPSERSDHRKTAIKKSLSIL